MNLNKKQITDVDVAGKRVLIRVDFNVPQDKKDPSIITNTARYVRANAMACAASFASPAPLRLSEPPELWAPL